MADTQVRTDERITTTYEKIETGFLITLSSEYKDSEGEYQYESKKYATKSATETKELLTKLIK